MGLVGTPVPTVGPPHLQPSPDPASHCVRRRARARDAAPWPSPAFATVSSWLLGPFLLFDALTAPIHSLIKIVILRGTSSH